MKKIIYTTLSIFFIIMLANACKEENTEPDNLLPDYLTYLEPSEQRTGDAEAGHDYLIYGDYLASGIPYAAIGSLLPSDGNVLNRTGDNANLPRNYTAVDASNGVRVVAPNCLECHAETINGQFILGLGNVTNDYSFSQQTLINIADALITNTFGQDSPEWDAYEPFRTPTLKLSETLIADVRGVNLANNVFAILAAHRDPHSFAWSDEELINAADQMVAVDVPAWWHVKKKNQLYYNGLGEGDFARLIMASNLLTVTDSSEAREVDSHFADVYAFLKSIEAPEYPEEINSDLALEGEQLFTANCSGCHGTYGENETYPNLLVDLDFIQTDPLLAELYYNDASDYVDWYNNGWFAQEPHAAHFTPKNGYVAPPLDGIWATAPYFHNGSVPTIEGVLNSESRPTYWQRTFNTSDYDNEKLGWNYETLDAGGSTNIYDTTLEGYGNGGHTFGDNFTENERTAVIEYLKTL